MLAGQAPKELEILHQWVVAGRTIVPPQFGAHKLEAFWIVVNKSKNSAVSSAESLHFMP
jgi:hypothetical protein